MKTEQSQPVIFGVETWPDFTIAHGASPPPIAAQLAQLSEQLMLAANCHILPAPARAPDPSTFKRALSELSAALAGFGSRAHASQAPLFWTDPAALASGEITRVLSNALQPGEPAQGFLVLIAEAISGSLIYFPRRSPIRVSTPVSGDLQSGGPYLVLVLCEAETPGRVALTGAHAVAIAEMERFMPVANDLERDIVRALIHLQIALDAYGIECDIRRDLPAPGNGMVHFCVNIRLPGMLPQHFGFAIAPNGWSSEALDGRARAEFVVTKQEWHSGAFIAWLIGACERAAGGEPDPAKPGSLHQSCESIAR